MLNGTKERIIEDWDFEKNGDIDPYNLANTEKRSFYWKCKEGHEYRVSFYSRLRSNGCKVCNNPQKIENIRKSKLLKGKSFSQAKPELLAEWNYSKNDIRPEEVSEKSHLRFWFKCKNNHEWQSTPQRRSRGDGCPICSRENQGVRVRRAKLEKTGISLQKKYPELLTEWDYAKNLIDPNHVSPNSNMKAFWKCKFGHFWEATIYNRTGNNSGCPFCKSSTSKLEVFIFCEMNALFKNVQWRSKIEGYECDVLLKDNGFGIEIDGAYWHDEKLNRDLLKHKVFEKNGIYLIRVRDESLPKIAGAVVLYNKKSNYIDLVIDVLKIISKTDPSLDFSEYISHGTQIAENEYKKILSLLPSPTEKESLLSVNPELAKEWEFSKNAPLTPLMFTANSEKKVYWKCAHGHIWEASIKNRHKNASGCPICYQMNAGNNLRKSLLAKKGISFAQSYPNLLKEWDYTLNKFSPHEISSGSSVKVYWKCKYGHVWLASVSSRTGKGYGCPQCHESNRSLIHRKRFLEEIPAFSEKYPELIKYWSDKNSDLLRINPTEVSINFYKKLYWICTRCNEEFTATAEFFVRNKICPKCTEVCNSLAKNYPYLVDEWDKSANRSIDPQSIHFGSKEKVWWKCKNCQHSWKTAVCNRTSGARSGCPKCSSVKKETSYKKSILMHRGSLIQKYPQLKKYWNMEENAKHGYKYDQITSGARLKVFWHCPLCGYKWISSPNDRVNSKYLCPKCKIEKL